MGRVFLGYGPDGRWAAVKVIHDVHAADDGFRARFRREVTASRKVAGGYTATVLNAAPESPTPWLASEFLLGPTLREANEATGPLPEHALLRLAAGLASALIAIHRVGIIHRDLKPSNVILTTDGPRVIDFGIARTTDRHGEDLTRTGGVIGTPEFMSPEQVESQTLTPASDVFALGSVLASAATGASPFAAHATYHVLAGIVRAEPDLTALPERIHAIAAPCLARRPENRPTPTELLDLIGPLTPSPEPWPAPVTALAHAQLRELSQLLDQTGERTTRLDAGPTLVTDPDRPKSAEPPPHRNTPAGSIESKEREPFHDVAFPTSPSRPRKPRSESTGPEARSATAGRRAAWWCLPGLFFVLVMGMPALGQSGSPKVLIWANIVIAVGAIAAIPVGNRALYRRRKSGYRTLVTSSTVAGLQGMTTALQAVLTGGTPSFDTDDAYEFVLAVGVYLIGPTTALIAIVAVFLLLRPTTRRWCRT